MSESVLDGVPMNIRKGEPRGILSLNFGDTGQAGWLPPQLLGQWRPVGRAWLYAAQCTIQWDAPAGVAHSIRISSRFSSYPGMTLVDAARCSIITLDPWSAVDKFRQNPLSETSCH